MINLAVNLAPVKSYKISVINLVYLPSNQSLANSFGTLTINVSPSNFSATVFLAKYQSLVYLFFLQFCLMLRSKVHLYSPNSTHPFQIICMSYFVKINCLYFYIILLLRFVCTKGFNSKQ